MILARKHSPFKKARKSEAFPQASVPFPNVVMREARYRIDSTRALKGPHSRRGRRASNPAIELVRDALGA